MDADNAFFNRSISAAWDEIVSFSSRRTDDDSVEDAALLFLLGAMILAVLTKDVDGCFIAVVV